MRKFTELHKQRIREALKGKNAGSKVPQVERQCPCGNIFYKTLKRAADIRRGKYCSRKCWIKYHVPWNKNVKGLKRPPFSEEWKNKISKTRIEKGLARLENNPRWRGGITTLSDQIRRDSKYKQWRNEVYNRDNYTCVACGEKGNGTNLEADHIVPLSLLIEKMKIKTIDDALRSDIWNIDNGRTLCKQCHLKTDTYGWRAWNNYTRPYRKGAVQGI